MKFSYNFLQSFFEEKLPDPKKLGDLLMMRFFEVEEIKKIKNDFIIDIDILSSRAGDCLSHLGVAREISAITGLKYKFPKDNIKESREEIFGKVDVEVKDDCNRYMLRGVKNIKVGESPSFIKKRLEACGVKSINNVVDIGNYVMLETGQPLHAFDANKIEGDKIVVRRAKNREKIVTLDEKRYELDENILVIADEFSPVGVAGIKGGIVPEIDNNTETIYLEAANFNPKVIRKGSKDLGIRTDASVRFEYGIPLEFAEIAMDRAVSLICEIAGGEVLKGSIDYYPEKREEIEIDFDVEKVRSLLGVNIPLKNIEKILKDLEFKIQRNENLFYVTVPYFRLDVLNREDVIEEIGRIYGYENIEPEMPKEVITPINESKSFSIIEKTRDIWSSLGFSETYNYSFINEEKAVIFEKKDLLEMEKPVSLEFKYLRPSLFPGLFKNLEENENIFSEIKMFEIGEVFMKRKNKVIEEREVSVISSSDDFYGIKSKINYFLEKLFLDELSYIQYSSNEANNFFSNKAAKVIYKDEEVACFGEVSEKTKEKMKIKKSNPVIAKFYFDKLEKFYSEKKIYEPISAFPVSIRDIALLVPKKTYYLDVLEAVKKIAGKTLKEVVLFDIYEGKEIPKGFKNFAFRLYFQHKGKTLSSEEVNKLHNKIIDNLDKVPEWKVRK